MATFEDIVYVYGNNQFDVTCLCHVLWNLEMSTYLRARIHVPKALSVVELVSHRPLVLPVVHNHNLHTNSYGKRVAQV